MALRVIENKVSLLKVRKNIAQSLFLSFFGGVTGCYSFVYLLSLSVCLSLACKNNGRFSVLCVLFLLNILIYLFRFLLFYSPHTHKKGRYDLDLVVTIFVGQVGKMATGTRARSHELAQLVEAT